MLYELGRNFNVEELEISALCALPTNIYIFWLSLHSLDQNYGQTNYDDL